MATPAVTGAPTTLPRRRFTVAEFYRLGEAGILTADDRIELIQGDLVPMTPVGPRHAAAVDRLDDQLRAALGARARVRIQNTVRLSNDTEPLPDVVVCQRREYTDQHPTPTDILLIIEVVDTSAERDRYKLSLYARAGVTETWLVDLTADIIEVHREPGPNGYRLVRRCRPGDTLTVDAFPEVAIAVADLLA